MPRLFYENIVASRNAEIFFWHIAENCKELSELIADNGLSLAEAEKSFKSASRQREWLATRALLQLTPYSREVIRYHSNGKPFFAGNNMHISISHTKDIVAIAISGHPIGIDVETASRNALAVTSSFLKPCEMAELQNVQDQANEAVRLWSAKEAAFKLASEKVAILKEIGITKNANFYTVTYPDCSVAKCNSYTLGDIILSVATFGY